MGVEGRNLGILVDYTYNLKLGTTSYAHISYYTNTNPTLERGDLFYFIAPCLHTHSLL